MHANKKELFKDYIINNLDKIYRLAFSFAKNQPDSEDIVNESVKRALMYIDSLKNDSYMATWFYRIVVNTANTYLKNKSKLVYLEDISEESLATEDNYQDSDIYNQVMKLEAKYRIVIILKYFEDMTFEQISEVLDENTNTVKTRVYTALDKLRIKICKEEGDNDGIHIQKS